MIEYGYRKEVFMKEDTLKFNYFFLKYKKRLLKKILELNPWDETEDILNEAIKETCLEFLTLSEIQINVIPKDSIALVEEILENLKNGPYTESFLFSLQFIFQDYLESLNFGWPILLSSKDEKLAKSFLVVLILSINLIAIFNLLDSQNKLNEFEAINMSLVEQTKTMIKICKMALKNIQGPLPNVLYLKRNDI